jgi:hypothetical protein
MPAITLGSVTLPPDLQWQDEFAWVALGMTAKTTLTGAEVVQSGTLQAARPITLQGGTDFAWLDYATIEALRTLASAAGATYTLTLADGRTFTVRFRCEETPVEGTPVLHRGTPDASKRDALQYVPIIRLKTV